MGLSKDWNYRDSGRIKVHVSPKITNRDTQAQAQLLAQFQSIFGLLQRRS